MGRRLGSALVLTSPSSTVPIPKRFSRTVRDDLTSVEIRDCATHSYSPDWAVIMAARFRSALVPFSLGDRAIFMILPAPF